MRTIRVGTGALVLSGLIGLAGCTPQATIVVTTTADTVADDGVTSLREAFALANGDETDDKIALAEGATYDLTDCAAGALRHTTAAALVVSARRSTIHQTCTDDGILAATVAGAKLEVDDATLVGGPSSGATVEGAGIAVRGPLTLLRSTVTGVDAGPGGSVIAGRFQGVDDQFLDHLTISSGAVTGNTGTAVRVRDGRVRFDQADIAHGTGDGLVLDGTSAAELQDARFTDNGGWGLRVNGTGNTRVHALDTTSSRNAAGGISCVGCEQVELGRSTISDNGAAAASGSGGGIAMVALRDDPDDPETVNALSVWQSTISGNRADRAGGGIFSGVVEPTIGSPRQNGVGLTEVTVSGNATIGDDQPGGGIAVLTGGLGIHDSEISDNVAGGSGSHGGGVAVVQDDPVTEGAILYGGEGNVFDGNRASGSGGGLYLDVPGVPEVLDDFTGNAAGGDGGGAYLAAPEGSVSYAGFVGNTAGGRGGGAYLEIGGLVDGATFRDNQAADGGGVFVGPGLPTAETTIVRSAIVENTASVRGGGLATDGVKKLDVVNTTLAGNVAPRGAGLWAGPNAPFGADRLALTFVTAAGNSAPVGANVVSDGRRVETFASLLVEPLGGGANCVIGVALRAPAGYSFASDASCGAHATDTVSTADPMLGPLADNGGLTPDRMPAPASPIGGTVPTAVCTARPYTEMDQRPAWRPIGAACEPGSIDVAEVP
jgi:hypothetical protein